MRCPPVIADEKERLLALAEYGLDEEHVLPDLEPVVQIAARMLDMPISAVNMIGSDRVFFAASVGIGECDMRREVSFCAHAITQDDVMVVLDATLDPRFHDNPLVTSDTGIRFYAGVPLRAPSGYALGVLCVIDSRPRSSFSEQDQERLKDLARLASDKLELRRLETAALSSEPRFEDIAATSPNAILCFDRDQIITFWNPRAAAMFGSDAQEITGRPLSAVLPALEDHPLREMIASMIASGEPSLSGSGQETHGLHRNGSTIAIELSLFCWQQGSARHYGAILADITHRRQQEDRLFHLANFDGLTGLANRDLFHRRVKEELAIGKTAAVLVIELDNFKDLSDTFGYTVGDKVLSIVAQRVQGCVRPVDTVARVGDHQFAVLLPKIGDHLRASLIAEKIIAAISGPIETDQHEVHVEASCGISISPTHGKVVEELIGNANLALYQSRIGGRRQSFVFVPNLRQEAIERQTREAELHRAVENHEFELFYQPQVRLADQAVVGAEALIRWKHPERGYLSPAAFLPALERGSLAAVVGTWVLETACAQAAIWRRAGARELRMGVNLSTAQFLANDLDIQVGGVVERYQLPSSALELEITENIILNRDDLILKPLQNLRESGVCIAFDDFGTGYASLSLLKKYPLTRIKIDQSFIRSMCVSKKDLATVKAAVDLASNYDLEVIAEGVESQEQSEILRQLKCEEGQGYLFGRPMPAHQFSQTLRVA